MKYRIAISGSYGGLNLGDEAILEGILGELRSTLDVDIVVFSYNAKDTEQRHKVRALSVRETHKDEIIKELKKLDLFILGGGGILYDGVVEIFLRDVIWAQELNIPTMIYAISAGPLKSPESKKLVEEVLDKTSLITVRENESKRILHDLGITKPIEVTADPALLIKPQVFTKEQLKREGINPEINLIGLSVREPGLAAPDLNIDHYHSMLANAADFMIERYEAQIIFIPLELGANRDLQHSHAIISKMLNAGKANVLKGEYTSSQLVGLMKHMTFCVGMRVHFLIFASLQFIPFISLPYASKVKGFLEELGIPYTPLENWNTGKICALIDNAWDYRKTTKKKLKDKIPLLKEKAKTTNTFLCHLLESIKK